MGRLHAPVVPEQAYDAFARTVPTGADLAADFPRLISPYARVVSGPAGGQGVIQKATAATHDPAALWHDYYKRLFFEWDKQNPHHAKTRCCGKDLYDRQQDFEHELASRPTAAADRRTGEANGERVQPARGGADTDIGRKEDDRTASEIRRPMAHAALSGGTGPDSDRNDRKTDGSPPGPGLGAGESSGGLASADSQGEFVFDNQMWILGGWFAVKQPNPRDVWKSPDGKQWTRTAEVAPWEHSDLSVALVYQNKMWFMGGRKLPGKDNSNAVWSSPDGAVDAGEPERRLVPARGALLRGLQGPHVGPEHPSPETRLPPARTWKCRWPAWATSVATRSGATPTRKTPRQRSARVPAAMAGTIAIEAWSSTWG